VDVKIEITLDSKHLSKLQDFLEDLKTSSSIAAKGQQQINQNNNNNDDSIVVWVRDGDEKKTKDHTKSLRELGFEFAYKNTKGKDDPHWWMKTTEEHWDEIKNDSVLDGFNIWTSKQGGS